MLQDRLADYKWLEENQGSKLLVYVTGDRKNMQTQIAADVLDFFADHLDIIGKVPKISLLLYTQGGDTMTAYSLVNLIRQFCEEFEIIIPSKARSSGTIISLGADRIMMTKQATLGPIDPSLNSPLNPQNPQTPNNPASRMPVSVESIQGYFDLAKHELNIQNESNFKEILLELSNQVHPLVLGAVYRSRTQIQMVARKLLTNQIKEQSGKDEKIDKIIAFLCSDSGSHDYAIYREEAKEELGLNIVKPNDDQYKVIKRVFDSIRNEMELLNPFNPEVILGGNQQKNYSARRVLLESVSGGTNVYKTDGLLTQIVQQIKQSNNLPPINRILIDNKKLFEGWIYEKVPVNL